MIQAGRQTAGRPAALAAVLLVAALVRLYALGHPMFLFEEGLVVQTADQGWNTILHRAMQTDAHPPFFYFLVKIISRLGDSELALRLPSAICGLAAVWALFRLGERLKDRGTGLVAAALLTVSLVHVELSRTVRPHALMALLAVLGLTALVDYLRAPSRRNLAWLAVWVGLTSLWHFNAVLVAGTQGAILLGAWALGRLSFRAALAGGAVCAVGLGITLWPLALRLGDFPGVQLGGATMFWTLTRSWENLRELLAVWPLPGAGLVGAVLLAVGLWRLARTRPGAAVLLAATVFLPLAVLVAARYGIIYSARNIAFLQPAALLAVACALTALPVRPGLAAGGILAVGAGLLLSAQHGRVYAPDAPMFNHNACQRPIAQALPAHLGQRAAVGFSPPGLLDFADWYFRRQNGESLRDNHVSPLDRDVDLFVVRTIGTEPYDPLVRFRGEAPWRRALPSVDLPCGAAIAAFRVRREPVFTVRDLPARFTTTGNFEDFYRHVYQTRDLLTGFSPLGDAQHPSRFGRPSEASFRFANDSGRTPGSLDVRVEMTVTRPGDAFGLALALDGRPEAEQAVGPIGENGVLHLTLAGLQPFRDLLVSLRMLAAETSATFDNIPDSVAFRALHVDLSPASPTFASDIPVAATGLDRLESGPGGDRRWGLGPGTTLRFELKEPAALRLDLDARANLSGQAVEVFLNDRPLARLAFADPERSLAATLPMIAPEGRNVLMLRYAGWNHGGRDRPEETFAPDDPRPLAASFLRLRLEKTGGRPAGDAPSDTGR